jgi:hypothetical protein
MLKHSLRFNCCNPRPCHWLIGPSGGVSETLQHQTRIVTAIPQRFPAIPFTYRSGQVFHCPCATHWAWGTHVTPVALTQGGHCLQHVFLVINSTRWVLVICVHFHRVIASFAVARDCGTRHVRID